MKATIIKRNGKCFVQLPSDFLDADEIELFRLKDGYFLVSLPLGAEATSEKKKEEPAKPESKEVTLSPEEIELLKKLYGIKFENRTDKYVSQFFSADERKILDRLLKRGVINLFVSGKYKDKGGVYNIPDTLYPKLKEAPVQTKPTTSAMPPPASNLSPTAAPYESIFKIGFTTLQSQNEAYQMSEYLRKAGKNQDVIGIKGFDGKYYVVSKKYFAEMSYSIKNILKEDMPLAAIAQACKTDEVGCRAVLQLMAENGEVVEKRKGIFAPA
jgi:hypothetical protein